MYYIKFYFGLKNDKESRRVKESILINSSRLYVSLGDWAFWCGWSKVPSCVMNHRVIKDLGKSRETCALGQVKPCNDPILELTTTRVLDNLW